MYTPLVDTVELLAQVEGAGGRGGSGPPPPPTPSGYCRTLGVGGVGG